MMPSQENSTCNKRISHLLGPITKQSPQSLQHDDDQDLDNTSPFPQGIRDISMVGVVDPLRLRWSVGLLTNWTHHKRFGISSSIYNPQRASQISNNLYRHKCNHKTMHYKDSNTYHTSISTKSSTG